MLDSHGTRCTLYHSVGGGVVVVVVVVVIVVVV